MQTIKFNYDALKTRIREVYGTEEDFAKAMEWTPAKLTGKLSNKTEWELPEVIRAVDLLKIPKDQIESCFFTEEPQEPQKTLEDTYYDFCESSRKLMKNPEIKAAHDEVVEARKALDEAEERYLTALEQLLFYEGYTYAQTAGMTAK